MQLPFLVVHGAWLWLDVLLAAMAAAVAIRILIAGVRERRRVRAEVVAELFKVTPFAVGPVVLRGTWRGGSTRTHVRLDTGVRTDDSDAGVWLEVGDAERIAIVGTPRVVHGSKVLAVRGMMTRSVRHGDPVVVSGALEREPAGDSGYREHAERMMLVAARDGLRVTAVHAQSVRPALPVVQHLAVAVLVGAAALAGLFAMGRITLGRARGDESRLTSPRDATWHALAAALPFSRDEALEDLQHKLDRNGDRTASVLLGERQLLELRTECPALFLAHNGSLVAALAQAKRCDPDLVPELQALTGDYAAIETEDPYLATVGAIGAGHWYEAASALAPHGSGPPMERDRSKSDLGCLGSLLRAYGGELEPFHVPPVPRSDGTQDCMLERALLAPPTERAEDLVRLSQQFATVVAIGAAAAFDLQTALGDSAEGNWRFTALDPDRDLALGVTPLFWLAPKALVDHPEAPPTMQGALAVQAALRAHVVGDRAAATRELVQVRRLLPAAAPLLQSWLELHEGLPLGSLGPAEGVPGATMPLPRVVENELKMRRGTASIADLTIYSDRANCTAESATALAEAMAGDGLALVRYLERCQPYLDDIEPALLGTLPRVTLHRAELATALRYLHRPVTALDASNLFRAIALYVRLRDLASLVGDTALVAEWQALLTAHASALADPRRVIALYLLTR